MTLYFSVPLFVLACCLSGHFCRYPSSALVYWTREGAMALIQKSGANICRLSRKEFQQNVNLDLNIRSGSHIFHEVQGALWNINIFHPLVSLVLALWLSLRMKVSEILFNVLKYSLDSTPSSQGQTDLCDVTEHSHFPLLPSM